MSNKNLTKEQLRKQMKLILSSLSDQDKERETEQMIKKITHFIQVSPDIKIVSSYAAMAFELNLDTLHLSLPGVSFCYPRCGAEDQMAFYAVGDLSEMVTSEYGIREPDGSLHSLVDPEAIDLFLCPAFAYTQRGERLGKGGGYYDRYLLQKRSDAMTLGVVFSSQIVAHVPTEPHDVLIDRVL